MEPLYGPTTLAVTGATRARVFIRAFQGGSGDWFRVRLPYRVPPGEVVEEVGFVTDDDDTSVREMLHAAERNFA